MLDKLSNDIKFIVVIVILLIALPIIAVTATKKTTIPIDYTLGKYDSRIDAPIEINAGHYKKTDRQYLGIGFQVKPKYSDRTNTVFQTSSGSDGIKVDIDGKSFLYIYVPTVSNGKNNYIKIKSRCDTGKWNSVEIKIDRKKRLIVNINGNTLLDKKDKYIKFGIADLTIGGNGGKGKFQGEISDFRIKHEAVGERHKLMICFVLIEMIFAIIFLILLSKLLYNKKNKLQLAILLITSGFILSMTYHFIISLFVGFSYPHNTFLLIPSQSFGDFFCFMQVEFLNPYFGKTISAQYPLVNFFANLTSLCNAKISFMLLLGFSLSCLFIFVYGKIRNQEKLSSISNAILISFFNYPILFAIDRGNYELLIMGFLVLFIIFFEKEKYILSGLFLAVPIAMKVYPAVFLLLFLINKKYRSLFVTLVFIALLQIIPLLMFEGGFFNNVQFLLKGDNFNNSFLKMYLSNDNLTQRSVTLYSAFKIIFIEFSAIDNINMTRFRYLYIMISAISIILLAIFIYFKEKELWKQVAILSIIMLVFPHISADYKLIHILIPFALYLVTRKKFKYDYIYIALFSLLLMPKDYYLFSVILSDTGTHDISIASIANPLIMIIMIAIIIYENKIRNRKIAKIN
jgi:hypothetical protein